MTGKIISYSPDRGKVLSGRTIPTTYFALSVSIRVQSLSHGFLLRDSTLNMTLRSVDFPKQPASDCLMCNRDRRRNILETKREWADRLAGGLPTATNLIATANPSASLSIFRTLSPVDFD